MNDLIMFGLERAYVHAPAVLAGMLAIWMLLALVSDMSPGWRRAAIVCAGTAGGLRAYEAVALLGPAASLAQAVTVITAMLMTALLIHGSGRVLAQAISGTRIRRRTSFQADTAARQTNR